MIDVLANASPFQVFFISGLIALIPSLALYDPRDFREKDPRIEKWAAPFRKPEKPETGREVPAGKEGVPDPGRSRRGLP